MELRIYTPELKMVGVLENMKSLLWRRRFYSPGEFSIRFPLTDDTIGKCKLGYVVSFKGANEAGVIEEVKLTQEKFVNELKVSGRFLSSYMDRRLIRPRVNYTGTVENAMRSLLMNVEYPLPLVELGDLNGFEETVTFQATYKNLLTYMEKLSKQSNIGFRFRPDFTARKIYFETYKGKDHSITQRERTRVTFAPSFGNMQSANKLTNEQIYKNIFYIGGQGEGDDRTFVVVGNTTLSGLERREGYSSQSGIQKEEGMTDDEYKALLEDAGWSKLADNSIKDSFDCKAIPFGNFAYRTDYDLGDVITIEKSDWGIKQNLRMTEVTEVYEHGAATIEPTFGDPLPEAINWEDKDE